MENGLKVFRLTVSNYLLETEPRKHFREILPSYAYEVGINADAAAKRLKSKSPDSRFEEPHPSKIDELPYGYSYSAINAEIVEVQGFKITVEPLEKRF